MSNSWHDYMKLHTLYPGLANKFPSVAWIVVGPSRLNKTVLDTINRSRKRKIGRVAYITTCAWGYDDRDDGLVGYT